MRLLICSTVILLGAFALQTVSPLSDLRGWSSAAMADDGDGGDGDGGDGDGDGGDGDGGGDDGGGDDGGGDDGGGDDGSGDDGGGDGGGGDGGGGDGGDDGGITRFIERLFGGDGRDVLEDEIVALGTPTLPATERVALAAAGFGFRSEHSLNALNATLVRLSLPSGLDAEEALELARQVSPQTLFDLHDLYAEAGIGCADCWGAELVKLASMPPAACARGAPLAIIDTGIDVGHPALEAAHVMPRSFLQGDEAPARTDHGTAVAAILVGESIPGSKPLAPGAVLMAANVFREVDGEPRATAVAVVRALNWAFDAGARVVAMSVEGARNEVLSFAIRALASQANLVAAGGNAGPNGDAAYPAAFPEVTAVAALDKRLRAYRNGTRGAYLEIAAPGVGVVSAAGDRGRKVWSGTSFAVPFVAAALLRARAETGGDAAAARALLSARARDLGAPGRDEVYGYGLLQMPSTRCW